jgi:type I restriction enzyme R subunit
MKQVLSVDSLEEAERIEDAEMDEEDKELFREMEESKNLKNARFFAFTATPKTKTLELFGTKDESGQFHPYHLYSMAQAIKEGFILDVLENYLSYDTYFKLYKKVEDDPKYAEKKAMRLLRNYVERHPNTIDKKTEIMLNHFIHSTIHKIRGKAKAMVVTKSRLHAVLYKKAFDKFIKAEGHDIKTLVAFTGVIKHDEQEYTENSMNNLGKMEIKDAFTEDKYKLLIVANKFQTGFDQPLLHTIYVDKMLNGVTAVQTLSRANRIIPGQKTDTLILDFVNKTEVIQKAFQPYYDETYLKEATDPHKLYELQDKLLAFMIFDESEVNNFVKNWQKRANQAVLHGILNTIVKEFNGKEKKIQIDFKKTLKRYQSIYSFLSQLIPFSDLSLEKLFIFNKFLLKKLPTINEPLPYSVLEDADIDSYKIKEKGITSIKLIGSGELLPLSTSAGTIMDEVDERLSVIIKKLNDAFGTDFSNDDRVFISRMLDTLDRNEDLIQKINADNDKSSIKAVFGKYFDSVMSEILNKNMHFYKKVMDNDKLRKSLESGLFEMVYSRHKISKK